MNDFLQHFATASHPQFLIAAYRHVFGRGFDETGYNLYLTQLYQGRSRADLLAEFLQSDEFRRAGRTLPALPPAPPPPAPRPPRASLEQYQDIWVKGRVVRPGIRRCAERYELIAQFCRQYRRPFTVLDLGANLAYFSLRLTEQFDCTAVAAEGIYSDWTREVLEQNDNPRVLLLAHVFRLADLRALAAVEHFDVVLALSVIHHLDGSFAESLAVLRSLGDHLILELPNEANACGQAIVREAVTATLPPDAQLLGYGPSHLDGGQRPIYRLSQPKTAITESYLGTPRTGMRLTITSDVHQKRVQFHNKPESRDWLPGINLHTWMWFHGAYPRPRWIADQLRQNAPTAHRDVQPWNVILGGGTARFIDADDPTHAFAYSDTEYLDRLTCLLSAMEPRAVRWPVRWCGPVFNPSGYASEAINFLLPLADRLQLGLEHHNNLCSESFVAGLPATERHTLFALRNRFPHLRGGFLIAHNPATGFRELPDADYRIGRTMFETDRLPAAWVPACNRMDEIWVPSRFNVETFAAAGVERDKLVVIPEAVDHHEFDPARHQPWPLPNRAGFNFLAVFEWSSRKAWDVLLAAYLREFSADDDVCLYLRTYLFGEPDGNPRDTIWQMIRDHAATLGLGDKRWPRIEILADQIPLADLPRLYRAADCLVAPSRGEGWGRPHHEAMLMELPVIATGWSGNTEFMNNDVAYLLDYELQEITLVEPQLWHYRGHRWANPSETHLRHILRHILQHPDEARAKGRAARAHMIAHYSRERVADLVVERLAQIEQRLATAQRPPANGRVISLPPAKKTVRIAWEGASGTGSLALVNRQFTRHLAKQIKPDRPDVTVRHCWPPLWTKPARGLWVVMQPWEYGHVPIEWVAHSHAVDEFWTPSETSRRAFVESGIPPDKIKIVPNGIDPRRFRPDAPPRPLPTTKSFKFLFVGGTIHRKGADLLLRAYRQHFTAADDVCLVIKDFGGDSFYAGQTLADHIRRLTDGPEILYLDETWPADELPGLYTACDCLVHPYRGEGFGLPVLEAMACGRPVIVTAGGATDDFATDELACRLPARRVPLGGRVGNIPLRGPGWLLEPDEVALAAQLHWVFTHRDEAAAKGRAASDHVRQHWTWERASEIAAARAADLVERRAAEAAALRARRARRAPPIELPACARLPRPFPPAPAEPKLTVCLITKNEERFLPGCLQSVRDLADQIVVVDTGSTDRTPTIAADFGAEVHEFAWRDDFAAARNAALEHARGDWILMLDADEEVTPEGREILRAEIRDRKVLAYRLPIVDVGREEEGCSYVPRLFRNAPGVFYVGRIHEQVFSSLEVLRQQWNLDLRLSRATLRHHGYTAAISRARRKNTRNLLLLQRAVEELPNDPNLLMNLGLELVRSGQTEAGLEQYFEAFALLDALPERAVVPELRETLLTQLAGQLLATDHFAQVVEVLTSPLARRHGLTASLHFILGLAELNLAHWREAAEQFRQCLAKRDRPALCPIHKDIHRAGPHHCLALCLTRLNDFAGAGAAFQAAVAAEPSARQPRLDYVQFLVARGLPVEALQQLHALVSANAADALAWQHGGQIALRHPELWEFAGEWTGEAVRALPTEPVLRQQRAQALLLTGRVLESLPLWGDNEPEASRQFLQTYRRLLQTGAEPVVTAIHEHLDQITARLPTAARALRAALAEATT